MNVHSYRIPSGAGVWPLPLPRWLRSRRNRAAKLELASLSDHMLRDLGLAGGRTAPPRDILRD